MFVVVTFEERQEPPNDKFDFPAPIPPAMDPLCMGDVSRVQQITLKSSARNTEQYLWHLQLLLVIMYQSRHISLWGVKSKSPSFFHVHIKIEV